MSTDLGGNRSFGARAGLLGLGLLVLLVCGSSVVASSASAAACRPEPGSHHYTVCIGGQALGSSLETKGAAFSTHLVSGNVATFDGKSSLFLAEENPLTCGMTTEGTIVSGKGTVNESGVKDTFSNCEWSKAPLKADCSIGQSVQFNTLTGSFGGTKGFSLAPEPGRNLALLQVVNRGSKTCPASVRGSFTLTGAFAETVAESEVEHTQHRLVGTSAKTIEVNSTPSNWLASEQIMELTGANQGQSFSIIEGR